MTVMLTGLLGQACAGIGRIAEVGGGTIGVGGGGSGAADCMENSIGVKNCARTVAEAKYRTHQTKSAKMTTHATNALRHVTRFSRLPEIKLVTTGTAGASATNATRHIARMPMARADCRPVSFSRKRFIPLISTHAQKAAKSSVIIAASTGRILPNARGRLGSCGIDVTILLMPPTIAATTPSAPKTETATAEIVTPKDRFIGRPPEQAGGY